MAIKLFDDQSKVVYDSRQAMRKHKCILIRAETGFGKTILSMFMIKSAVSKGNTCFFIVPRKQLLQQSAMTFLKDGVNFGYIASGKKPNPFASVQLCTSGTLSRRLETTKPPTVIFIDEADYGGAEIDRIVEWAKRNGCWIILLTATPWRTDGVGLGKWATHMVDGPSLSELIRMKRLSEYKLFAPQKPDMDGVKINNGEWNIKQTEERVTKQLVGNAVDHYKKYADGKLAVGYAVSVKKAIEASEIFNSKGIPSAHINAKMDDAEIDKIIMRFARREIQVLYNCELLVFGFDLSSRAQMDVSVEAMIDTQPTQSLRKQRQKNGRVLRMKDFPAIIMDHSGNVHEHGLPDDDHEWTLDDRVKQKRNGGENTEPTRQCSNCYFVHRPTPSCPCCGFEYPIMGREIEEVDGELVEFTDARIPAKQEVGIIARNDGFSGLVQYAKDKGYKNPSAYARKQMQVRGLAVR